MRDGSRGLAFGPYPRMSLGKMFQHGSRRVRSIPTGIARRVKLPLPPTGRHMLARLALDEHPVGQSWDADSYQSVTPWTCLFEDVSLFGDGGIVVADGGVVLDTLAHCGPCRQWFVEGQGEVTLMTARQPARLEGT